MQHLRVFTQIFHKPFFSTAFCFEPLLISVSHFDLKSAPLFDGPTRHQWCSRRLRRIMETLLKYQPSPVGGEAAAHITHPSKCICKHFMSVSLFSVRRLACGPSGDPSLPRSICSCLLHRKSRNVLQLAHPCTSLDCYLCRAFMLAYIRLKLVIVVARIAPLCKNVTILLVEWVFQYSICSK